MVVKEVVKEYEISEFVSATNDTVIKRELESLIFIVRERVENKFPAAL